MVLVGFPPPIGVSDDGSLYGRTGDVCTCRGTAGLGWASVILVVCMIFEVVFLF